MELEKDLEQVGQDFDSAKLELAQKKTWEVLFALRELIAEDMTEDEANKVCKDLFIKFGSEKNWHPTKIRFGVNSLKTFREVSEPNVKLKKGDTFFIDIGCVFGGYEGDVGKTFVLGSNPEAEKMIAANEQLFKEVHSHWKNTKVTGQELYDFASKRSLEMGYELILQGGSGHRVSEFPHAVYHRGNLKDFDKHPTGNRWILEIQTKHPTLPMGAFFEDLL